MADKIDLQLERAEFDQDRSGTECGFCKAPLVDKYFQINGTTACERCAEGLQAAMSGGSPLRRAIKAIAAGAAAALGGAILYWAILALTGYEFGLIAIVVGYAVGFAVSWGAEGRGGWRYQTLAVVLTYVAISTAYVPVVIQEIRKQTVTQSAESQAAASEPRAGAGPVEASTVTASATRIEGPVGPARTLLVLLLLVGFVLALPLLGGFSNIIGLLIIGFGLYQAWKMNRRRVIDMTGPHQIASPSAIPSPQGS